MTANTANAANIGGGSTKCPICKKPTEADFKPFCSKRCADVDLGRWFSGSYAVPTPEISPEMLEDIDLEE